jgi:hypothetical protein
MRSTGIPLFFAIELRTEAGIQMVMNIENNLRLYLHFKDELNLVEVSAGTDDWDQRIAIRGIVQGKEQLVELLNEAPALTLAIGFHD